MASSAAPPAATPNDGQPQPAAGLTADESAVYDRQIRVWGHQAQQLMRSSHILLYNLTALMAEIAKNLTLAGVGTITLCDYSEDVEVQVEDLNANFLLRSTDVSKSRRTAFARELQHFNPHCRIHTVATLPADLSEYTAVVVSDVNLDQIHHFNDLIQATRDKHTESSCSGNTPPYLFVTGLRGYYGYMLEDLGKSYTYSVSKKTESGDSTTEVQQQQYEPIPTVLNTPWSALSKIYGRRDKVMQPLYMALVTVLQYEQQQKQNDTDDNMQSDNTIPPELLTLRDTLCKQHEVQPSIVSDTLLQQLYNCKDVQLSPLTSVLGGYVGQEVLQVVSQKDAPMNNVLLYDAVAGQATVRHVKST